MKGKRTIFPLALSYELRQALKDEAKAKEQTVSAILRTMIVERMVRLTAFNEAATQASGTFPCAWIKTELSAESALGAAGASALLFIRLDSSLPESTYLDQAVAELSRRLSEIGADELPPFGRPLAIEVHYRPGQVETFALPSDLAERR